MEQNANIVLCGFMGCGKTTIGKLLAKNTGWPFIDMDHYIEQNAHMSISEIFAKHGEAYFRDLEHTAVKQLAKKKVVLSAQEAARLYMNAMYSFCGRPAGSFCWTYRFLSFGIGCATTQSARFCSVRTETRPCNSCITNACLCTVPQRNTRLQRPNPPILLQKPLWRP